MPRNFTAANPDGPKNLTDIWITPSWIIDKIRLSDLDPCGFKQPNDIRIVETAYNYFYEEDDGLSREWFGSVFMNPPYSQNKLWMKKLSEHNNGIALIFARTETRWFQDYTKNAVGINFIKRRIQFLDQDGTVRGNANAPSCLIAYGENNYSRIKNIDGIKVRIDML